MDYDNIKAGFYWVKEKEEEEFDSMALVYGVFPFLRIDLWKPVITKHGMRVDDWDISKKPLIFGDKVKDLTI